MDSMLEWSRAAWRRHLPNVPDIDAFVRELGDGTIHGLAHASAIASPDKLAVRLGDESMTHGELDSMAGRFAASLGIREGDRVLLVAPVSLSWLGVYLGILPAGGVNLIASGLDGLGHVETIPRTGSVGDDLRRHFARWRAGAGERQRRTGR